MMMFLISLAAASTQPGFDNCDNTDAKWVAAHNEGVQAMKAEDPASAVKAARKAVDRQPTCRASLVLLGKALFRVGDPGSIAAARRGLELYPEDTAFLSILTRGAFAAQDFAAALTFAERAVRADPADLDSLVLLVSVLIRRGEYERAEQVLAAASAIAPADIACWRVQVLGEQEREADAPRPWRARSSPTRTASRTPCGCSPKSRPIGATPTARSGSPGTRSRRRQRS